MFGTNAGKLPPDDGNLMFKFAHDLRSHLRTVLTRIELAQHAAPADITPESQSLLEEAASAARDIGSLVSAMVAYCEGEIEEGTGKLLLLVGGVQNELRSVLQEARAEVVVQVPEMMAPLALKVILKELLTNSCRFRALDRPLRISITARVSGPLMEMSVEDNGPGVEAEFLERIFAPFYRLHPRDEYPGHGLGLARCRKIAMGLNGTIVAEPSSVPPGLMVRVTAPAGV
jgi:signal transduction histidine kinase